MLTPVRGFLSFSLINVVLVLAFGFYGGYAFSEDSLNSVSRNPASLPASPNIKQVSYQEDIKPILENRCVVCHSCYDAPCQLKLGSPEGIARGATKKKVYDGDRLSPEPHTRLFVDAKSTEEWRKKGFFGVLEDNSRQQTHPANADLLANMLKLKGQFPLATSGKLSDKFDFELARDLVCPKPDEFDNFKKDHPDWGMPYAFPAISQKQDALIAAWLGQGAKFEPRPPLAPEVQRQIQEWEAFFNKKHLKNQLVSRYIYEHLFLGHIHFQGRPDNEFFTLVRSRTPDSKPLDEIVTDLPYQNPGVNRVYYRFKPVMETIVDKTHFVYELNAARMRRYMDLFIKPQYAVNKLPDYVLTRATNPFETFNRIPPNSRYRFLLDDASYFVDGFIKGPVCRGQVALNSIQDRFWVMFVSPNFDLEGQGAKFLSAHSELLSLPDAEGKDIGALGWYEYDKLSQQYLQQKEKFISALFAKRHTGLTEKDIWDGDGKNYNTALTIFRHFDSASVVTGFVGDFPKTAWVVDYPLLERLHYLLVAGFDVYGTVWHQLATRKYMDFLRMDGENNFLRFMPSSQRMVIHDEWYVGIIPEIKQLTMPPLFNNDLETGVAYKTNAYKAEFLLKVNTQLGQAAGTDDKINRCGGRNCADAKETGKTEQTLAALRELAKIKGRILSSLPEISFLRIRSGSDEGDMIVSILVDKDLKNLSTLFAEGLRHDPEKDKLTVFPGFIGSYPSMFFDVDKTALGDFITDLANSGTDKTKENFYAKYAIRRTRPDFWDYSDWMNQEYQKKYGLKAGLFDLNRYENL